AGEVASILGIETVLVPRNPGNLSAFGLQASDIRRDYVRTLVRAEDTAEVAELEAVWSELEAAGRADLVAEGVSEERIELRRSADARYVGEAHEVPVHVEPGLRGEEAAALVWRRFHDVHERTFGFAYRGEQQVEVVNLRVQAVGEVHRPQLTGRPAKAGQTAPVDDEREVYVGGEWARCPIHERDNLEPGMQLN